MKHNDKKAIVARCRGEWERVTALTSEEKIILKERYLPNGIVRMTHEAIAEGLGIPIGRVISSLDRAFEKILEHEVSEQRVTAQPIPQSQGGGMEVYRNPRTFTPWYRMPYGNQFETLDIVLAAALMSRGYEFVAIRDPAGGHKKRIVLEVPPEDVPKLMEEFMDRDFMVDATTFHARLKTLKTMLYNAYNGPNS